MTLSNEILREFREYERTSTTVLNAYVGPRVSHYLRSLKTHLANSGFDGAIQIMRSNGGSMSLAHAAIEPVSMMASGPVAGMMGAGYVAKLLGMPQAIGFDMGGTTAKATLITDGVPAIEDGYFIGGYATGQPMQLRWCPSSRSVPAAAAWPGAMAPAACMSDRKAPVRTPGQSATAAAARSPRSPMPTSFWGVSMLSVFWVARWRSTRLAPSGPSGRRSPSR